MAGYEVVIIDTGDNFIITDKAHAPTGVALYGMVGLDVEQIVTSVSIDPCVGYEHAWRFLIDVLGASVPRNRVAVDVLVNDIRAVLQCAAVKMKHTTFTQCATPPLGSTPALPTDDGALLMAADRWPPDGGFAMPPDNLSGPDNMYVNVLYSGACNLCVVPECGRDMSEDCKHFCEFEQIGLFERGPAMSDAYEQLTALFHKKLFTSAAGAKKKLECFTELYDTAKKADMLSMSTYSLLGTERECIQKCLSACYDLVAGDPKP